jgi:hypothetical protein
MKIKPNDIVIPKPACTIIDKLFDGHYTLMKFTTNYRFCFGTLFPDDYFKWRWAIEVMSKGKTASEAMMNEINVFYSIGEANYGNRYTIDHKRNDFWNEDR